jgi:hypothetical protein
MEALTGSPQPAGLPRPEAGLQPAAPTSCQELIPPSAHPKLGYEVEEDLLHPTKTIMVYSWLKTNLRGVNYG